MSSMRSLRLTALLLLAQATVSLADPSVCDLQLKKISENLSTSLDLVRQIPPALVRGETTPTWQDFDLLNQIIENIKAGKQAVTTPDQTAALQAAIQTVKDSISDDPALTALRDASKNAVVSDKYEPGEYELKLEYQKLLSKINHELPEDLRIKGVRLPHDGRLTPLIAQAKKLLETQEQRFEPYFKASGFSSPEALKTALMSYDDAGKKLAEDLDGENVELAMNRPEGARWWVPRVGFQNQRVSGSSRGSLNPPYRNHVEATMTGQDVTQYTTTDDQFKPVYGYLKPKPQAEIKQGTNAQHYGDDVYVFKKDHVRGRLTWTSGDSFGPASYAPATPDAKPTNWRGFFIPWKDRILIGPDVISSAENDKVEFVAAVPGLEGTPVPPIAPKDYPTYSSMTRPPAPQPTYPPLPTAPPGPELAPIPTAPPAPPAPQYGDQSLLPLMPPLQPGEKFEDALARLESTDEYKAAQAETTSKVQEYQQKYSEYTTSDAYKSYLASVEKVRTDNNAKVADYQKSQAYLDYQKELQAANQKRAEIDAAFQQSDVWKKYMADLANYQQASQKAMADYQAAVSAFNQSDEGKLYLKQTTDYYQARAAFQSTDQFKWFQFNQRINPYFSFNGTSLAPFQSPQSFGYIELQYWGPVTLDDVEIFEFRKTPPSGEFLKALQSHHIKIRDGRTDPAVDWTP